MLNPTIPVLPPTVPFSLPAPSSPGTPTPPVPGRRVCFAAVPLPGLDASTPLAPSADTTLATAADKNLTSDTLLANWWGNNSDVIRKSVPTWAGVRVEGKQPIMLTLSGVTHVTGKPARLGQGVTRSTVSFVSTFRAQKVDQDNCVIREVPVDSMKVWNRVVFSGDGVNVSTWPSGTILGEGGRFFAEPGVSGGRWSWGAEGTNISEIWSSVPGIEATGNPIVHVDHGITGQATIDGKTYGLTTTAPVRFP